MTKPRVYGMRETSPKMSRHRDRCLWDKAYQRNREIAQRKPVAGQIAKKKEAAQ